MKEFIIFLISVGYAKKELNTDKIRDYYTVTGKFRGASHSKCNKILGISKKLPIIFLNLQGYDGHLIFKELKNFNVNIEVIPKTIDSSNINDVIKTVLNFIFYEKILHAPKNTKSTKRTKGTKSTKNTKSIKTQPSKSIKGK